MPYDVIIYVTGILLMKERCCKVSENNVKRLDKDADEHTRENIKTIRRVDIVRNSSKVSQSRRPLKSAVSAEDEQKGLAAQAWNVLKLMFVGKVRKAIHYCVSDSGRKSWILLLPIQILLPLALCVCFGNIFTQAHFGGQLILRIGLLWLEQLLVLLVLLRLMSAISNNKMGGASVTSLIAASMTPMTVCALVGAAVSFIFPALTGALIALGMAIFAILLYMGVEFACISAKVHCFGWFAGIMLVWLTVFCIIAKQLINFI